MKVAYIRVSTAEQNTARQENNLNDCERVFIEKISGKNLARPQLKAMLDFVREGDCVVVDSYSRLARNTADLLNIVTQLEKKGVSLVSRKENVDTSTPQGKLIFTIFAGLAQFEREQTLQRQKEGIALAKREGKYLGRKPIENPDNFERVMKSYIEGSLTCNEAMEVLRLKPATFYRKLKAYKTGN